MKIALAAGILAIAVAALAAFLLAPVKTTPQMVLGEALNHGAGLNAQVWSAIVADSHEQAGSPGDRRGLSSEDAKMLIASCVQPSEWTYVGDEAPVLADGVSRPHHFAVMKCGKETGTLLARLWMNRDMVDHPPELVSGSYFLACGVGQCPDFAVGGPPLSDLPSLARPFKVQQPVTKQ